LRGEHDLAGIKTASVHPDISTTTGERMIIFALDSSLDCPPKEWVICNFTVGAGVDLRNRSGIFTVPLFCQAKRSDPVPESNPEARWDKQKDQSEQDASCSKAGERENQRHPGNQVVGMPSEGKRGNMNKKFVQDIMVPLEEYPCIPETHTLRNAISEMEVQILRKGQLSLPRVALVFDSGFSDLLGLLRRRDIMRGLEPRFLVGGSLKYQRKLFDVEIDPNLSELSHDKIVARMRKRADRLVRDFMIPIKVTIDHNDHIMKAMSEMVDQNTSLLPVLKDNGVVGVVRSVDVLSEIALIV
jgi:CBS domain-containing protein